MPFFDSLFYGQHINTVHGAGLDTEVAAGALIGNHGVHQFGGTQYGIYRAGLNALGTAYALVFANIGYGFYIRLFTVLGIQLWCRNVQQIGNGINGGLTAGGAFINGVTAGNGLGVGTTAGKATLAALGLGQQFIDLLDNGVALDFKFFCGKAE